MDENFPEKNERHHPMASRSPKNPDQKKKKKKQTSYLGIT